MQVKKEVIENVRARLQRELDTINHEIWRNKREIKALAEQQAIKKRSRGVLMGLIRSLPGQKRRKQSGT